MVRAVIGSPNSLKNDWRQWVNIASWTCPSIAHWKILSGSEEGDHFPIKGAGARVAKMRSEVVCVVGRRERELHHSTHHTHSHAINITDTISSQLNNK